MKQLINIGATPNDGTGDYLNLAGQKLNNNFNDLYAGRANVHDFGAKGDGVTDDTAAIQAAIDFAYANKIVHVYMPAGRYLTTTSLWLNPIANGRDPTNPSASDSNWSLWLVGDGWGGSEAPGTNINYTGALTALFVGSGQNVGVKDLQINGSAGTRSTFPTTKVGINVLAAGGGAHISTFDGVFVGNFYQAFAFGLYVGSLDDSNTLLRCSADNCVYGFYLGSTQNFINELDYCAFHNCKTSVFSNANLPVKVNGGNYSSDSVITTVFTILSVMPSWTTPVTFTDTDVEQNGYSNAQFTLTISDPNNFIPSCDTFAIDSTTMGVVPFKQQAWNPGTGVLTLKFVAEWVHDRLGAAATGLDAIHNLPMQAAVNAATYLYACERITVFGSVGIQAKGVHIENATNLTRVAFATPGWAASTLLTLKDIFLNWDSSNNNGSGAAVNSQAYCLWIMSQVWPVIHVQPGSEIDIDNINAGGYWRLSITRGMHARIRNIPINSTQIAYINILSAPSTPPSDADSTRQNTGTPYEPFAESEWRGSGDADRLIFGPVGQNYFNPRQEDLTRSPTVGYYPAPWVTPRLTPGLLDVLLGTLPAVRFDNGAMLYEAVCGDCIYSLGHFQELDPRDLFVKFHHVGWSWGQQLPYTWSYVAGTNIIRLGRYNGVPGGTGDVNGVFGYGKFIWPGLVFGIDYSQFHIDAVTGVEFFTITAVHDFNGYLEVRSCGSLASTPVAGVPGTTYTGTYIMQQPFSVTKIGNQSANALTDATVAGRKYYVGDIVWQRTPVASGSMGWMCVTAGVAGAGAVFKTMPNLGP